MDRERKMHMQKKTPDYDNVFKTMKMKHKRLFVSVINDVFGRNYPKDVKVEILPSFMLREQTERQKQQRLPLPFQMDRRWTINQTM